MFTLEEIDRILTFVRFNYENTNPKDDSFIKDLANLWFDHPEKKYHEMLRVSASKTIESFGLDKI